MESDIIRYYEQYDEEGRLTRRRWGRVLREMYTIAIGNKRIERT